MAGTGGRDGTGEILGHPKGLYLLFFAEMWERFSFYGMRALLIFYLTKHFLFSEQHASLAYGAYMSLVYITPLIGGYLADHYLGQRKAVLFGGVLIAMGHILLGFEGTQGEAGSGQDVFWLALATIIMGTGFLKANIATLVGELYPREDIRRDPAYTIFYMGINVGALLGPLVCGYLGERVGWSYGFGAAAVGMIAGVIGFALGKPLLLGHGEPPDPVALARRVGGVLSREWLIYILSILGIGAVWWLIQNEGVVGQLLLVASAVVVVYLLWEAFRAVGKIERDRLIAILFLLALNPIFWGLYEQTGSSLNLFTDQHVNRIVLGWNVPASAFQSVNSFILLICAPIFAWGWTFLARRGLEPSAPAKFGLGIVQVGIGFLVLVAGAMAVGTGNPTPMIFLILLYFFHTTGELCLSPVGLSAMSTLSPGRMVSLVMGTWYLAMAGGEYIAGLIAATTGGEIGDTGSAAMVRVLDVYSRIGWIATGVGVGVMLVAPFVKRLSHTDKLAEGAPAALPVDRETVPSRG